MPPNKQINEYSVINLEEVDYKQSKISKPELGMLVFDLKDHTYGYITAILDEYTVAVGENGVVELGAPLRRIRLLTPLNQ